MDFTREPVVETVITPKEGYKLLIRSSHGENREEYRVDAVEVIAFGHSYFFRSLEKPKAFLLPLAEYEVLETKEARPILKNPSIDKPIKIGAKSRAAAGTADAEEGKKKHPRKRREKKVVDKEKEESIKASNEPFLEEGQERPSQKRTLLPPPTSLISEQISRYKDYLKKQEVLSDPALGPAEGADVSFREEKIESLPGDESLVGQQPLDFPLAREEIPSFEEEQPSFLEKEEKIVKIKKQD